MKKIELLAPAGDFLSLKAAVSAGCDAVYIGGKMFGARAFSGNFSNEEICEAIIYCHLRGVKVFVTVNTLIYEREVDKFLDYIEFLHLNNVDAVILQDIGMLDLVRKTFPNLELHASTQMHIHNESGVELVKSLGVKRVVLARETNIELIKNIKKNIDIDLEIFVHGSLCISYSGQCLMSSLIGHRSGNRGSCAGTCRQKYKVKNDEGYLLSAKDLCSLENIGNLIDAGVDSLKIEGRMKSPLYVYFVTKLYRSAIDSYLKDGVVKYDEMDLFNLKKIFNREYTKGFLFNECDIVNKYRPNHLGVEIGRVIGFSNGKIKIKLCDDLNVLDGIRVMGDTDFGFNVSNITINNKKTLKAFKSDIVEIPIKNEVEINSLVVKTSDYELNKNADKIIGEKKIGINISFKNENNRFYLKFDDGLNVVLVDDEIVSLALNNPTKKEQIINQLSKLGNTIYKIDNIDGIVDDKIFINVKDLNEIRRKAVLLLDEKRLYSIPFVKKDYFVDLPDFKVENNFNVLIKKINQYEMIKGYDFKNIYLEKSLFDKIDDYRKILKLSRVLESKVSCDYLSLVGEMGTLKKGCHTDFSLNVVNSYAVAFLHSLGVLKITLSLELGFKQVQELLDGYYERYKKQPNLEVIVYGKAEAMICKYMIESDKIIDRFNNKYPIIVNDGLMTIYNYECLKIGNYDDYFLLGINNLRLNILDESDFMKYFNVGRYNG